MEMLRPSLRHLLRHLTYANVMSTLAVFLLMGGVSYAAVTLGPNSVGDRELKKNAVTSDEVKDQSLKAGDFADGQLPAGSQGPKGAQGPAGPKGDPGAPDSSDLLTATLPANIRGQLTVNGDALGPPFPGFRLDCPKTCTLSIVGNVTTNTAFSDWFDQALQNPEAARKNFTLTIYDQVQAPFERYDVTGGLPTSRYDNGFRYVFVFDAQSIKRVPV